MNYYRVIYQPPGSHDKEWTVWEAESTESVHKYFNMGTIIKIEPTTKEDFEDNKPDFMR